MVAFCPDDKMQLLNNIVVKENIFSQLIKKTGRLSFLRWLFHEEHYTIARALRDCQTVLDLGCGANSPIAKYPNIKYSVGVDIDKVSILSARKRKTHTKLINEDIDSVDFDDKSFDAVTLIGILEHLNKSEGHALLIKAEKWAKKKIIVSTPNGFYPQGSLNKNIFQKHLSGWTAKDLSAKGYQVHGITGAKFMYKKEKHKYSKEAKYSVNNLRFNPKELAFIINSFLQLFAYYLPNYAFTLFAVKKLKKLS